ncbi:MAG: hypothetical protein KA733_07605 [Thauera sp.]|nr:hypothetical protein [Thauera sp.]
MLCPEVTRLCRLQAAGSGWRLAAHGPLARPGHAARVRQDGIEKVLSGITDMKQVRKVCVR